jgi:ketosteroid isomerase-like protein
MTRTLRTIALLIIVPAMLLPLAAQTESHNQPELLKARETVWRTFFAGDVKTLADLVPPDTIVISGDNPQWRHQADVLESSRKFHAAGGKLVRLEFPRTEVQWYGDVAIVWSSYSLETEMDGKRTPEDGRVTEIFVHRNGHWTNPGWHTDSGK